MHQRISFDAVQLLLKPRQTGGCRLQIRHGTDRRVAAVGRRLRSAPDGFLIRKTGLPQMHMYICEARNNKQAVQVLNGCVRCIRIGKI